MRFLKHEHFAGKFSGFDYCPTPARAARGGTQPTMGADQGSHRVRARTLIVLLHVVWIAALAIEGFARGAQLSALWQIWLSIFVIAQFGRYWAISSLGLYWNTRILIVPGAELVRRGPYKFLSHPNYVVVALELFSAPMVFGATITAVVFSVLNAALLLLVRIPAEERALEAYSATVG
jgi:methyltransferase